MNFNQFINFFFINSKISALLFFNSIDDYDKDLCKEGNRAKTIYKKQIRRYLGLGFLLSFIPGTEPFLARKNLLSTITGLESSVEARNNVVQTLFLTTPLIFIVRPVGSLLTLFEGSPLDFFKGKTQLNRLNPLFYLGALVVGTLGTFSLGLAVLINWIFPDFELPDFIGIPLAIIVGVPTAIVGLVYFIAFMLTEYALNTLQALLIDPLVFAFESIHQLLTAEEFSYTPTKDYKQINSLLNARGENTVHKVCSTKELTLIEDTKEDVARYERHNKSSFYTFYKDTALFMKSNQRILSSDNLFKNLFQFSFFCKIETKLNKDVVNYLAKTGIEADRAEIATNRLTIT